MYLDNDTVIESGNYRVKAVNDFDPLLPEGDGYVPQFMVPSKLGHRTDLLVNIDQGTATYLTEALRHFEYDVEIFERWANIFHGINGTVRTTVGYSQGDLADIIVWPDEYWLDTVGQDSDYIPSCSDVADLASYIWGDVIALELQELTVWHSTKGDTMETYETIDTIGGLYVNQGQGDEYVKDMAQELLESNIA